MKRFRWFGAVAAAVAVAGAAVPQATTRVSVDSGGVQGNGDSAYYSDTSISADGRYVGFDSDASNLVPGDANLATDVFVHDRLTGQTTRVSVDSAGAEGNGLSWSPSISADGRYVAFMSDATNLVAGDTNGMTDVYVHDCQTGATTRVNVDSNGTQGNTGGGIPSISADGRYVAFHSPATNLVLGDTNGVVDIFVHDCQSGATERVSVATGGAQANGESALPSISADGRYVAFQSLATNLVLGDYNGYRDIFVRDILNQQTIRVSVALGGAESNQESAWTSISADGRHVAFQSLATNLVPGETNGTWDIFVRDIQASQTTRVSVDSSGLQGIGASLYPQVSSHGEVVVFVSFSTLVPGDTNDTHDVFSHEREHGTTTRISVNSAGGEADSGSVEASLSADGRYTAFRSDATNLVSGDTNGAFDVFVRDRGAFVITAFCFGDGSGTSPCPCGNTGTTSHGCDNSILTGGALLSGSGQALLSADTLILTSSSERPTAFSLFWQGGSEIAPRVFGDGVGCMGPPLKRMYRHNAVGGTVTAPQGADLSVSARSVELGDPITPGTMRVYHVFYRDPDPDFCTPPFGSTFNTTNGLRVTWGR